MIILRFSVINFNIDVNWIDVNVGLWFGLLFVYFIIIGLLVLILFLLKYDLIILIVSVVWRKGVDGWKMLFLRVI